MIQLNEEAKHRLIVAAQREGIMTNVRAARLTLLWGGASFGLGTIIVAAGVIVRSQVGGLPISIVAGGIAISLFALVRVGRGLFGLAIARKQLRGLDERALPVARVVR